MVVSRVAAAAVSVVIYLITTAVNPTWALPFYAMASPGVLPLPHYLPKPILPPIISPPCFPPVLPAPPCLPPVLPTPPCLPPTLPAPPCPPSPIPVAISPTLGLIAKLKAKLCKKWCSGVFGGAPVYL